MLAFMFVQLFVCLVTILDYLLSQLFRLACKVI